MSSFHFLCVCATPVSGVAKFIVNNLCATLVGAEPLLFTCLALLIVHIDTFNL